MAGQSNRPVPDDFYAGSPRRDALWRACPPECQAYMEWQAKAAADLRALSELIWDCRFQNGPIFKGRVLRAAQPFALNRLFADWEEKRLARGASTSAASLYSLDSALLERIVRAALNRSDEAALPTRGWSRAALQGSRGPDCRGVCRLFEALSWGALESATLDLDDLSSPKWDPETGNQWLARAVVSTSLRALCVRSSRAAAGPGDDEDSEYDEDVDDAEKELAMLTAAVARQQHDVAAAVLQLSCARLQRLSVESLQNSMTAAAVAALPSCSRLRRLKLQGSFNVQPNNGGGLIELLRAPDGSLERLELLGVHVARKEELCNALVRCSCLRSLFIGNFYYNDTYEFPWPQLLASPHLRCLELCGITTTEGSATSRGSPAASLETLMLANVLIGAQDAADIAASLARLDRLSVLKFGFDGRFWEQQALMRPLSALTGLQELTLSSPDGLRVPSLYAAHCVKRLCSGALTRVTAFDLHTDFPALKTLRALRLSHLRLPLRWLSASFAVALRAMASLASLSVVFCVVDAPIRKIGLARPAPLHSNAAGVDVGGTSPPPGSDAAFGPTCLGPLLAALESCVALEELELAFVPLLSGDARQLASVAPRLPRLSKLTVLDCKLSADSMAHLAEHVPAGCDFVQ